MIYAENILVCIAVPLLLSLLFLRGKIRLFTLAFLLGMGVCLISAYIGGFVSVVSGQGETVTAVFFSPVIEELMKFLPLLLYLFLFEPREDRLFLAALGIGVGFSLFENCCHMLSTGAGSFSFILVRSMAVGVMHIVSMLTLAVCLSLAIRAKALTIPSVLGALSLSMTFHGLYNLLVSGKGVSVRIGYSLPILTAVLLYVIFRRFRIGGEEPEEE